MLIPILYLALLLLCTGLAFAFGGAAERWGGAILFLTSIASGLVATPHHGRWHSIEPGILIVDLLCLVCFLALAARSKRFWPIWEAAFQLLAVAADLAEAVQKSSKAVAYALNEQFWAYPMLVLLAVVSIRRHMAERATATSFRPFWKSPADHDQTR